MAAEVAGLSFPPVESPLVSIVMCARDHEAMTLRALQAVVRNSPPDTLQLILVDDGSAPGAQRVFEGLAGIDLIRNDESVGFLMATNAGLPRARGTFTCLLNNDTEVEPGWLEPILAAFEDPTVGAVGSRLINPDGTVQETGVTVWSDGAGHARGGSRDDEEWLSLSEVDYSSGAALTVRTELLQRLGGLDERFAPAFYEDVDLCFGVRSLGYRVVVAPESNVVHYGGQSYGKPREPWKRQAPARVGQFLNEPVFAAKWAHTLHRSHVPRGSRAGLVPFRARERPRMLIVDAWIPAHDRDAGSLRMTWIARLLNQMGVDVTLWATGGPGRREYADAFRREGIEVWLGFSGFHRIENRANLWDIVMVSRPDVGAEVLPTIRQYCSRAPLLYDTVDVHHVRMEREAEVGGALPDTFDDVRYWEEVMCAAADVVITVSAADADHLRPLVREASFFTVPLVQPPWPTQRIPAAGNRNGLLFIGGYRHPPNRDACRWFASEIWPRLAGPNIPVTFLGEEPPEDLMALEATLGFRVPGFRADVTPDFDSARVFVCPLRFGSGVKGKILQALSAGLPIVATSLSIEGMDLDAGRDLLVADDAPAFAAAVDTLLTDNYVWDRISRAGVRRSSDWSVTALEKRLQVLVADLLSPRMYRRLEPRWSQGR